MTTDDTTRPVPTLHEPAAPEPGATAVEPWSPAVPRSRGPRMRTLVLGLVLLAISGTTALRLLTDVRVDNGVVALVLLLVAGALLLGGGVLGAAREARSPGN
jgi:uncharacterized membrane protein